MKTKATASPPEGWERLDPFGNDPDIENDGITLDMVEADVEEWTRNAINEGREPDPEWERMLRQARAMHEHLVDEGEEPVWVEFPEWVEEMD